MLTFFSGAPVLAFTTWPSIEPLGGAGACARQQAAAHAMRVGHAHFMIGSYQDYDA
jgi:hypothetical protein